MNTIENKCLCAVSSNLADMLTIVKGWALLVLKVRGQRLRSWWASLSNVGCEVKLCFALSGVCQECWVLIHVYRTGIFMPPYSAWSVCKMIPSPQEVHGSRLKVILTFLPQCGICVLHYKHILLVLFFLAELLSECFSMWLFGKIVFNNKQFITDTSFNWKSLIKSYL